MAGFLIKKVWDSFSQFLYCLYENSFQKTAHLTKERVKRVKSRYFQKRSIVSKTADYQDVMKRINAGEEIIYIYAFDPETADQWSEFIRCKK